MFIECIEREVTKGKPFFWLRVIYFYLLGGASTNAILIFRIAKFFRKIKLEYLCSYFIRKLERIYCVYIHRDAEIKPGLSLPHPVGIVIGQGVIIGEDVVVYQHVTLGGSRRGDWRANNYPTIGDGTVIFSGAVIIGKVNIGKNCVIGANAVVTKDIPDNATAVGVPARIVIKGE